VDRPEVNILPGRIYVQPQWVYDSINRSELVKESDYGVGKPLPPHLSPFVTYQTGDYVPGEEVEEQLQLEGTTSEAAEGPVVAAVEGAQALVEAKEALAAGQPISDEQMRQLELEAEVAGIPYSEFVAQLTEQDPQLAKKKNAKQQQLKQQREEQERRELAKMVLSNKQRKILEQVDRGKAKRAAAAEKLRAKKRQATEKNMK
jgi:pescadillo protein